MAALDARAVAALLHLAGQAVSAHGNIVVNLSAQQGIEVLVLCTSSFPLADVGLAYLVATLYCGQLPRWGDIPWFAGAALTSVALTELRLSLMTVSESNYYWLHNGYGSTIYTLVAMAFAVLFPLLAAYRRHGKIELCT